MNYEILYLKLCNIAKTTKVFDRLKKRNPTDPRLSKDVIYTEKHHILPKSLGGNDEAVNLIEVLPEEHFLLHKIRYKAYRDKQDFLACRIMMNGFENKQYLIGYQDEKKMLRMYAWFRQEIYEFRKTNHWQSESGRKRISESRMGKIPARNILTGEIVEISKDNPLYLSGQFVHHSKGKSKYIDKETNETIYCFKVDKPEGFVGVRTGSYEGTSNTNYSGITDDEIIDFSIRLTKSLMSLGYKEAAPLRLIKECWDLFDTSDRKFPALTGGLKSGFRFGGNIENLYSRINEFCFVERNKKTKLGRLVNKKDLKNAYDRIPG